MSFVTGLSRACPFFGLLYVETWCMRMQRGDAEMAQKLWRVVRACVELGPRNPIQQIHDQGAGGNCNVVCPCSS